MVFMILLTGRNTFLEILLLFSLGALSTILVLRNCSIHSLKLPLLQVTGRLISVLYIPMKNYSAVLFLRFMPTWIPSTVIVSRSFAFAQVNLNAESFFIM